MIVTDNASIKNQDLVIWNKLNIVVKNWEDDKEIDNNTRREYDTTLHDINNPTIIADDCNVFSHNNNHTQGDDENNYNDNYAMIIKLLGMRAPKLRVLIRLACVQQAAVA